MSLSLFIHLFILITFAFFLILHLSFAENSGRLTWVRLLEPQEQRYLFPTASAVFSWVQAQAMVYGCQCLRSLTCAQMSVHTIAHGGCNGHRKRVCTETDCGRKIPCRTGELNRWQWRAGRRCTKWATSSPHPADITKRKRLWTENKTQEKQACIIWGNVVLIKKNQGSGRGNVDRGMGEGGSLSCMSIGCWSTIPVVFVITKTSRGKEEPASDYW